MFQFIANLLFGQTGQQEKVAGTKYSLIPPKDFVAATAFSGFQHAASGASIMLSELPAPLQTILDGFTSEALLSKGMTMLEKKEVDFANGKATLIRVRQPANGTVYFKQILIFGNETHTVLVNGIYPEAARSLKKAVDTALMSVQYHSLQNDDPLEAVKYSVNTGAASLQLAKYIAGSLIYTRHGKIPSETPVLIISSSIAKQLPENRRQFALDRLHQLPGGGQFIVKENLPVIINGMEGYEITAAGTDKEGRQELIYQVILFNSSGDYYIIAGTAKEDFEDNLSMFKEVASTFRLKTGGFFKAG